MFLAGNEVPGVLAPWQQDRACGMAFLVSLGAGVNPEFEAQVCHYLAEKLWSGPVPLRLGIPINPGRGICIWACDHSNVYGAAHLLARVGGHRRFPPSTVAQIASVTCAASGVGWL